MLTFHFQIFVKETFIIGILGIVTPKLGLPWLWITEPKDLHQGIAGKWYQGHNYLIFLSGYYLLNPTQIRLI